MSFLPPDREISQIVPEFKDLEVSELEAILQELNSADYHAVDTDEAIRLRHELQVQRIMLEMQRRELESLRQEQDASRARFASLYALTPIAYATFDTQGRIREINPPGAALLGEEREQLLDTHFSTYLHAGESARFVEHLAQVLASGQRQVLDLQLCGVGGYRYDVRLLSKRSSEGDRPACLSAIVDLTEQKQIEEQIRRSDDFSRSVLNALPAQIAVLDANGTIIAMNEAWQLAVNKEDAPPAVRCDIGMNYLRSYRDVSEDVFREAPQLIEGIQSVIDGTQAESKLQYASHTPEAKRWFLVWTTPMAGEAGGAVVAHVNITARMLAQEDARKRGEALARAARISSVGILASALAHEITQPLTALGQFSSTAVAMLSSGEVKPLELAEVLQQIDSEVQRAGEVMRRLRTYMGHGATARLPLDLCKGLDAAVALVNQKLTEKKIELILELPEDLPAVVADQVQITQVLVNLLYNSIEAIDRAGGTERKILIRCTRDRGWIHVSVSDTGPGLDPEWRETIFDLFETDRARGIGMGLAISRSIIEEHGGRLWAESEPTEGAEFHFTLPAMQEEMSVE